MPASAAPAPARSGLTLTQQIFLGLALGIVAGWLVSEYHPDVGPVLQAVQPAVPAPDQDDHRAADLRHARRRDCRRRTLQSRRPDGTARDHLLRGGHDPRAAHRTVRRQRHEAGRWRCNLPHGAASDDRRRPRRPGTRSCSTSCPSRSSEAMAEGDVLQIVVFSILFAIALAMIGEKGRPVDRLVRGGRRDDVQVHEHRDALRADWRRRGHRLYRRPRRARGPVEPRLAGRDAVRRAGGFRPGRPPSRRICSSGFRCASSCRR